MMLYKSLSNRSEKDRFFASIKTLQVFESAYLRLYTLAKMSSRVESESFTVQTVNDSDSTLDDIFASVNVKYADSKT